MRAEGMQVFSHFHPDNPMLLVGEFTNHSIEAAGDRVLFDGRRRDHVHRDACGAQDRAQ